MERRLYKDLLIWKNDKDKKPLIIQGARQVGKTWLMKEFGKREYTKTAYVNFDGNENLRNAFSNYTDIDNLIINIEVESNTKISKNDTLIIFDEIQECPNAITSLKYFYEKAPEYNIIVAGSLLGLMTHNGSGFPIGKVDFLDLYPLNFLEFLDAIGENLLKDAVDNANVSVINSFSEKLTQYLKYYYFIGGMPEVVQDFVSKRDFEKVRKIQNKIIRAYINDFSKHTDSNTSRKVTMIWDKIPSMLAKENKKFTYSAIKKGARAKEFETALYFLKDAGLSYIVNKITKPQLPLKSYEDVTSYKIYILDVGLLGALSELNVKTILEGDVIFTEFKGALTECFVLNELKSVGFQNVFYWQSKSSIAEVDFIAKIDEDVVPIEVKAGVNLKAKSLKVYRENYVPKKSIRTSLRDFKIDEGLYNIPLYAISKVRELLKL